MKSIFLLSLILFFFSCNDDDTGAKTNKTNGFDQQVIRTELTNDLWCTNIEIENCDQNGSCQIVTEILQLDFDDSGDFTLVFVDYPQLLESGTWLIDSQNFITLTTMTEDTIMSGLLRMNSLSQFDLLDPQDPSVGVRFYECNDIIVSDNTNTENLETRDLLLPLDYLK